MPRAPRKPPIDDRPTSPQRPSAKQKEQPREAFIGNDSATMMADETFAEFEERMRLHDEAGPTTDGEEV